MAILLSFRKTDETPETVTYQVSPDPDCPELTLVVDKRVPEKPLDGDLSDRAIYRAHGMALREYRRTGQWPAHGSHQA